MPVPPSDLPADDNLLRPQEVAKMFGVRTPTIARWAREGKLMPLFTPGGHRRYRLQGIRSLLKLSAGPDESELQMVLDAVRLYQQGWDIRQVAEKFDCSYGVMRRILQKHTTLRNLDGRMPGR